MLWLEALHTGQYAVDRDILILEVCGDSSPAGPCETGRGEH